MLETIAGNDLGVTVGGTTVGIIAAALWLRKLYRGYAQDGVGIEVSGASTSIIKLLREEVERLGLVNKQLAEQLNSLQNQIAQLRTENSDLRIEISKLNTTICQLNPTATAGPEIDSETGDLYA